MIFKKGDLVEIFERGKNIASLFFPIQKNLLGILVKNIETNLWIIYFPTSNYFLRFFEFEFKQAKLKNEPPK